MNRSYCDTLTTTYNCTDKNRVIVVGHQHGAVRPHCYVRSWLGQRDHGKRLTSGGRSARLEVTLLTSNTINCARRSAQRFSCDNSLGSRDSADQNYRICSITPTQGNPSKCQVWAAQFRPTGEPALQGSLPYQHRQCPHRYHNGRPQNLMNSSVPRAPRSSNCKWRRLGGH